MLHGGLSGSFRSAPPVGTSAYKAYQYQQRTGRSPTSDGLSNLKALVTGGPRSYAQSGPLSENGNPLSDLARAVTPRSAGGYSGGSPELPAASPALDYYQAALASHYGMDATTAYQEALANTSYQRSVQDMLNAGLNPSALFAAGRVSGANGVGYATQLGSGFVDSGSSGGGSAKSNKLFSKGLYHALQVVGGGLAVAVTKHPASYFPGATAAKGVLQALNGFFR